MIETVKQVASDTVSALKGSPMLLVLVLINTIFLGMTIYLLEQINQAGLRRDSMINDLMKTCFDQINRQQH
jgi:hypothetical protein